MNIRRVTVMKQLGTRHTLFSFEIYNFTILIMDEDFYNTKRRIDMRISQHSIFNMNEITFIYILPWLFKFYSFTLYRKIGRENCRLKKPYVNFLVPADFSRHWVSILPTLSYKNRLLPQDETKPTTIALTLSTVLRKTINLFININSTYLHFTSTSYHSDTLSPP